MNNLPKLNTEAYAPRSVKASEIPEEGIEFFYTGIEESEGKFGTFYIVTGRAEENPESEELNILFNSKKLASLFRQNAIDLKNTMIRMSGRGSEVLRNYDVEVVAKQTKL